MRSGSIGKLGWYAIVAGLILVIGGYLIWHAYDATLEDVSSQIETSQSNVVAYQQLIAKRKMFRRDYTRLAGKYLSHEATPTSVEAQFTDTLAQVAERDHVSFVGITYGTVNGNSPPPPDPHVDANGQPIHDGPDLATPPVQDAITNLGGTGAGDPRVGTPNIATDIFTRVPAGVTFKGEWRNLLLALQDISKQTVLMSVSQPEIRRLNGSQLVESFNVQLLTPAITVVPSLLVPSEAKPSIKQDERLATMRHNRKVTVAKPAHKMMKGTVHKRVVASSDNRKNR